MQDFTIRAIDVKDLQVLQSLSKQTFTETFASSNTKENMDKYLLEALSLEKLTEELNNPNSLFYFIEDSHTPIGYLKLNMGTSQTELNDNSALEIERIYVTKAYQGKKVGQKLYEKAIQVAKDKEVEYVWLGVWEENHKAIRFYTKNGFTAFDKHIFTLGNEAQTDIMMKLTI